MAGLITVAATYGKDIEVITTVLGTDGKPVAWYAQPQPVIVPAGATLSFYTYHDRTLRVRELTTSSRRP